MLLQCTAGGGNIRGKFSKSSLLSSRNIRHAHRIRSAPVSTAASLRQRSCSRNICLALRMLCLRARRKRRSAWSSAGAAAQHTARRGLTRWRMQAAAAGPPAHQPAVRSGGRGRDVIRSSQRTHVGPQAAAMPAGGVPYERSAAAAPAACWSPQPGAPNSGCSGPASISISSRSCCTSCHSCRRGARTGSREGRGRWGHAAVRQGHAGEATPAERGRRHHAALGAGPSPLPA